ncbi:GspE/PulE family protein [Azoarcus olearius]|uniref:General secretion pathway protein E n=1 Tax=Azoarcus sp. (strain BH72) TaxID=418699 RepID=A1KAT8_AZOSB|nr:GspE/PulE family protein [Azoarcus olearius]ANQ86487.1 general secretion pathway protein E [Azoarcus olearius]CAL95944.1 general secretion pathway protein E [Azoarcus olearius]
MSATPGKAPAGGDVARRLAFFKGLQAITTRIHATQDIDEIIFELSADICALFDVERLSIYVVEENGTVIATKVKTGLQSVQNIRLPIAENSVAGYVAATGKLLNIADVYDADELHAISPKLEFRREVDEATGYRARQMLAAPITNPDSGKLEGVIQLINLGAGAVFSGFAEEGLLGLAQTLGVAFGRHQAQATLQARSRFDALVADGRITPEELGNATRKGRESGIPVEVVLITDYRLTEAEVGEAAARFYGVPYEPYRADRVKPMDLLRNIKRDYVQQSQWLPLEETTEGVVIMTTDPEQVRASRIAENVFPRKKLAFRVTTRGEFDRTVNQFFEAQLDTSSVNDLLMGLDDDNDEGSLSDDVNAAADNELVKLVNKVIIDAYKQGASDIHVEPRPGKEKTLIRFRKDGTLVPYIEVPASYRNPLITRIKIMCDLDISERRRPQDGKIKFRKYAPLDIELRVATVPTAGGTEDVVMRILAHSEPLPLGELALSPRNLERLRETITKPYGVFFVCGPTGSGKTTTLHSILGYINTPETKIWTIEDPVEITQKGLRQVQVNRKAGLDFATMMRAFLRADPDVIMVGEMRDEETVSVGIEASLTGHLVLSTLHTNSAPESVIRLLDMGMDPFNFSDALLGVLAQRLAKRLCRHCRQAYIAEDAEIEHLLDEYCADMHLTAAFQADPEGARAEVLSQWRAHHADGEGRFTLYRAVGCPECNHGYRGRVGLHELMVGTEAIKRVIQGRGHLAQMLAVALQDGMRTLRQDGIEKVLGGITDLKQVRKVCLR